MKELDRGMAMLDIYELKGELVYSANCDEDLSRWLCRYCDEPHGDLTSEADWMIRARDLKMFLAQPNNALIKNAWPEINDPSLPEAYSISEIESFIVHGDEIGAIALFRRNDDGKLSCDQMYMHEYSVPQSFWEALYPDTYERAIAKIRGYLFSEDEPIWYFLGENSRNVYEVTSDYIVPCDELYDEKGNDTTNSEGTGDGLDPRYFREKDDTTYWRAYFEPEALSGTDYPQKKLDTPEKLLLAAGSHSSVEDLLRDRYNGVLTDEEYSYAARELRWQEYHRTHPEAII